MIASLEIGSRGSIELPNGGAPAPYVLVFRLVRLFKNPLLTIDLICDVVEGRKLKKKKFIFETKKENSRADKGDEHKGQNPVQPIGFCLCISKQPLVERHRLFVYFVVVVVVVGASKVVSFGSVKSYVLVRTAHGPKSQIKGERKKTAGEGNVLRESD